MQFQFSKFSRVPAFAKVGQSFKADLEIVFKNMQRKYDCQSLDLYSFFNAIEHLVPKIYKSDTFIDGLQQFLDNAIEFFEPEAQV
jgi:hypothetical protein